MATAVNCQNQADNPAQQLKGNAQKVAGKIEEELGRAANKESDKR
jgi:uncharacterized protein YjbJ (UPF0337 family)